MASSTSSFRPNGELNQWHTSVWAVWRDVSLNCMVCLCPSCAFADTVTRLDGRYAAWCPPCFSHTCASLILLCAFIGADTRRQIRETFQLPQEPCNDYVLHCFCCWCALCQEAREVKYRSQLQAPSSLAAQLVPASDAPEVQLMARTKSKAASLKEWEWRPVPATPQAATPTGPGLVVPGSLPATTATGGSLLRSPASLMRRSHQARGQQPTQQQLVGGGAPSRLGQLAETNQQQEAAGPPSGAAAAARAAGAEHAERVTHAAGGPAQQPHAEAVPAAAAAGEARVATGSAAADGPPLAGGAGRNDSAAQQQQGRHALHGMLDTAGNGIPGGLPGEDLPPPDLLPDGMLVEEVEILPAHSAAPGSRVLAGVSQPAGASTVLQ